MVKNKKIIFLIIIFLIAFYIILSIILAFPKGKTFNKTVFLGSGTKVSINNGNINVYNEDVEIKRQKVKVFFKGDFVDGYISSNTGESSGIENIYTVTNKDGDYLLPEYTLIAHTPDINIKVKESTVNNSVDYGEFYKFAESNNISLPSEIELDYMKINTLNIDNDNNDEYIYSVGFTKNTSEYASYVFLKNDDNYTLIVSDTTKKEAGRFNRLYFADLIDFNEDNNYEFVVNRWLSEYGPDYYELYSYNGSKFTKIGGE